jgi:hypothetical protein
MFKPFHHLHLCLKWLSPRKINDKYHDGHDLCLGWFSFKKIKGKITFVKTSCVLQGYIPQGNIFSWDKFVELLMGLGFLGE